MRLRVVVGVLGAVHMLGKFLQPDCGSPQRGRAIAPDLRNDLVVDIAHDAFDLILHLITQASAGFRYTFFPGTFRSVLWHGDTRFNDFPAHTGSQRSSAMRCSGGNG